MHSAVPHTVSGRAGLRRLVVSAALIAFAAVTAAAAGSPSSPYAATSLPGHALAAATTGPAAPAVTSVPEDEPWDGLQATTDQPDTTNLPTIHVIYLHASDQPNRMATFAKYFIRNHEVQSQRITNATGMAFRWDERRGADGVLYHDITTFKSKVREARLVDQFAAIRAELIKAKFNNPNKKYLVWVDAANTYCAQSEAPKEAARYPGNAANATTYSMVYRYYDKTRADGGFCPAVAHELVHGLGAVQTVAPNDDGGGHCNDYGNDFMCGLTVAQPADPTAPRMLDGGNDDYLDPAADLAVTSGGTLPWWTINLNRFLCPRSAAAPATPDCAAPNLPQY